MKLTACATFLLAAVPASAQVIEDFEHNNPALWTRVSGVPFGITTASAHDGMYGASVDGATWAYRLDKPTAPGDTLRWFVRMASSGGRTYCGVAASANGCFSAVMSTNTGNIILQENANWGFTDLATAPVTWVEDVWYQLELDWATNGDMTVTLYDEAGTTMIATTGATPTTATAGGIAMRGFGHFGDIDTISSGGGGAGQTYCTAKTNSLGCTPSIGGTGVPSATATSGFTVDVGMVRNQKPGLFFYKAGGARAGLTFQCGTLCVGPAGIKRTPAQSAGGNPPPANDCSGVYSLDMNAFAAGLAGGNPDPALGVMGTTVHCQAWGRDQGFAAPCNTTLSDGLEYVIGA